MNFIQIFTVIIKQRLKLQNTDFKIQADSTEKIRIRRRYQGFATRKNSLTPLHAF